MNATQNTTKFQATKYGLKHDPRGAHVVMNWQGRELLGVVKSVERDEALGATLLHVNYFCGEPWPIKPWYGAVDVLIREYEPA